MPRIQLLKEPGFVYDLNFLFFIKFNYQIILNNIKYDQKKREEYDRYLSDILDKFGDISDDLYVFYHAGINRRCLMTKFYLDSYKESFAVDFNFDFFKNLLNDYDQFILNIISFYLYDLSPAQVKECYKSNVKLFNYIKESNYTGDEKSKLYEFFINPIHYIQKLQYELMEKELILKEFYKSNFDKIINVHNNISYNALTRQIEWRNFSFLKDENTLYISYCLLNKYLINFLLIDNGVFYILGYDYLSIIDYAKTKKTEISLEDLGCVLSDSGRINILNLLSNQEMTCKDLEKIFHLSGSTIYHHISIMTRSGLLKTRNEGKTILYSVNKQYFNAVILKLIEYSDYSKGQLKIIC